MALIFAACSGDVDPRRSADATTTRHEAGGSAEDARTDAAVAPSDADLGDVEARDATIGEGPIAPEDAEPCRRGCASAATEPTWIAHRAGPQRGTVDIPPALDPATGEWMIATAEHIFRFDPSTDRWGSEPIDRNGVVPGETLWGTAGAYFPGARRFVSEGHSYMLPEALWTIDLPASTATPARWGQIRGAERLRMIDGTQLYADPASGTAVLLRRAVSSAVEVWRFDGGVSSALPVGGAAPPANGPVEAAYDPGADRLFVMTTGETLWIVEGVARGPAPHQWRSFAVGGALPIARSGIRVALDAAGDRIFWFGGHSDRVTEFRDLRIVSGLTSGAPMWTAATNDFPGQSSLHTKVFYDAPRGRLMVLEDTWVWSHTERGGWTRIASLPGVSTNGTALDVAIHEPTDRLLAMQIAGVASLDHASGCHGPRRWSQTPLGDTVPAGGGVLDRGSGRWWFFIAPTELSFVDLAACGPPAPPRRRIAHGGWSTLGTARSGASLAFDSAGQRLFYFGGYSRSEGAQFWHDDLWMLDLSVSGTPTWVELPFEAPIGGLGTRLFYAGTDRLFLAANGMLWALDGVGRGAISVLAISQLPGAIYAHRPDQNPLIAIDGPRVYRLPNASLLTQTPAPWTLFTPRGEAPPVGSGRRLECAETTPQCFVIGGPSPDDLWILDGI